MAIDYGRIELLVLDVDGVMTDGRIILTPSGEEIKCFHCRDGAGIKYWQRVGKKLAIITGRCSPAVELRARELGIDQVSLSALDKLPVLREMVARLGLGMHQVAVMGDDLTDLPMMHHAGLSIAPADAVEEVRRRAHYVTVAKGGEGAVREGIELILRGSGLWDQVLQRYLSQMEPSP